MKLTASHSIKSNQSKLFNNMKMVHYYYICIVLSVKTQELFLYTTNPHHYRANILNWH
mgnify:CR=1 FL=1